MCYEDWKENSGILEKVHQTESKIGWKFVRNEKRPEEVIIFVGLLNDKRKKMHWEAAEITGLSQHVQEFHFLGKTIVTSKFKVSQYTP